MFNGKLITLNDYLNIVEMAMKNGKQPGDSIEEEAEEYFKNNPPKKEFNAIDKDVLLGDLRESGFFKILDLTDKD